MLLTLLYHQVGQGKYSNKAKLFENHLCYISKFYKTALPGEKLPLLKISICLTFDDATDDFYTRVFPLLKKYNLKAVLAVPVKFIGTKGYCTWDMLKEISCCKLIQIASHSYSHSIMTNEETNLSNECQLSKNILEKNLENPVLTFVYPFGKFNKSVHKKIKLHYHYVMRIGSSLNLGWHNFSNIIYRVPSDNLKNHKKNLSKINFFLYSIKLVINLLRLK